MCPKATSEGLVSSKLKAVLAVSSQMSLIRNGTGSAPSIGAQQGGQCLRAAGEKRCKDGMVQPQKPAGSVLELLQGSGTKTRGSQSAPGYGPEEGPLAAEIHNPLEAAVTAKVVEEMRGLYEKPVRLEECHMESIMSGQECYMESIMSGQEVEQIPVKILAAKAEINSYYMKREAEKFQAYRNGSYEYGNSVERQLTLQTRQKEVTKETGNIKKLGGSYATYA
ncbi:hypothetical protein NDU88_004755 [Pleurodeles waltl]|uniref:Uncharacterized protein n=1 Tax=Pleurodeles waltl TaxID=8319 RepID=A0AAV7L163_PLEWA|nr:hypothetical protein NDU88_004755 [Pleurodeles waltl]